jgi:hypothetical protein
MEEETSLRVDAFYPPDWVYDSDEGRCWYFIRAPAQDISSVTVSKSYIKDIGWCVWGLLVEYENGDLEALGQFQWDLDTTQKFRGPLMWIYEQTVVVLEKRDIRDRAWSKTPPVVGMRCILGIHGSEGPNDGSCDWRKMEVGAEKYIIWWIQLKFALEEPVPGG